MNNIDLFNVFMLANDKDFMRCKICDKTVSRNESCSFHGINCVCDKCREKLSDVMHISYDELLIHIQKAGETMKKEYLDNLERGDSNDGNSKQ